MAKFFSEPLQKKPVTRRVRNNKQPQQQVEKPVVEETANPDAIDTVSLAKDIEIDMWIQPAKQQNDAMRTTW